MINENKVFYEGTLIEQPSVGYDPVAMVYTLQLVQGKVYKYTRRSEKHYDVSVRNLWVTIGMSTPHIKSFYDKAEKEKKKVDVDEVCNAIKSEWKQYLSYGLYSRNTNWIGLQEGQYWIGRERLSREECIKVLEVSEEEFESNSGVKAFSPY